VRTGRQQLLLFLILAWAFGLRAWRLDGSLFSVDESESTINALTILDRGVPTDRYLGLPIYENTLTEPWPESPEYEFRDLSYSSRGLAVYHGWLPLYSIAASLKAFGIRPDRADAPLAVHRSNNGSRAGERSTRGWRITCISCGVPDFYELGSAMVRIAAT